MRLSVPNIDKYNMEIASFKQYLENKGSFLVDMKETHLYYLLPYIKNPKDNLLFAKIFKRKWVEELRKSLNEFLDKIFNSSQIIEKKEEAIVCENNYDMQKNLLKFTKNLLKVSIAIPNGTAIDRNYIANWQNRINKFEKLILPSNNKKISPIKTNEIKLNYAKIKYMMANPIDTSQLLNLLKALRLRLNNTKMNIISEYIANDILDCKGSCKIIEQLIFHSDKSIVEESLNLIIALTKRRLGVLYLSNQSGSLTLLSKLLYSYVLSLFI